MTSPIRSLFVGVLPALLLALPAAATAHWTKARSPNFIVYSEGNGDDLRESTALLEEYDQLLRGLTGTTAPPSPNPLKVYLLGSTGALKDITTLPEGALGFYSAQVGGTAAFAVRSKSHIQGLAGQDVLLHEYAHHFMNRYYPAYYPGWYTEGFAEYVMTAKFVPGRIEVGRYNPSRAISLLTSPWVPIERILTTGSRGLSPAQLPQFYAESWLIVHYLFATTERQAALTRYLADLNRNMPEEKAFQAAFGVDHRGFEAALKTYMNGSLAYGSLTRQPVSAAAITLDPLPASADDLLPLQQAVSFGRFDPPRDFLTPARKIAARFPGDPYARRILGRMEILYGDRAAGVAIIDELLKAAPRDAELLYYRGSADYIAGNKDKANRAALHAVAAQWFARAVEADPSYYTARYYLARCAPTDQPVSDETLAQLIAAHRLAPQVSTIALATTTALMKRQRYGEAAATILPIARNPHGGGSTPATTLLAEIRRAMGEKAATVPTE